MSERDEELEDLMSFSESFDKNEAATPPSPVEKHQEETRENEYPEESPVDSESETFSSEEEFEVLTHTEVEEDSTVDIVEELDIPTDHPLYPALRLMYSMRDEKDNAVRRIGHALSRFETAVQKENELNATQAEELNQTLDNIQHWLDELDKHHDSIENCKAEWIQTFKALSEKSRSVLSSTIELSTEKGTRKFLQSLDVELAKIIGELHRKHQSELKQYHTQILVQLDAQKNSISEVFGKAFEKSSNRLSQIARDVWVKNLQKQSTSIFEDWRGVGLTCGIFGIAVIVGSTLSYLWGYAQGFQSVIGG